MNKDMQKLKAKYSLKKITDRINKYSEISFVKAYHAIDLDSMIKDEVQDIFRIDYPIAFKKPYNSTDLDHYFYALLDHLNYNSDSFHWFIPYYSGSDWWIELRFDSIGKFINCYFNDKFTDFTAIDLVNYVLFDISNTEDYVEYRVKYYYK